MIGVEPAAVFLFAGRTDAALSREQHFISVVGNLACSFLYPLPEFGIGPVFLSPVFIDFILVGAAVAATAGSRSRSIVRGLRPFFLLEIAGRGNHRCFPPPVLWVKIVQRMAERSPATSPPAAGDTSNGAVTTRADQPSRLAPVRDRSRLGMTVNDVVGAWKAGLRERARARRNQKPAESSRRAQYRSSHFAILHVRCTHVKH
jgi:hypothetical protein